MSVSFNDLIAEVITITNRPDLLAETQYAIKAATTKAHNADEFTPDIRQVVVVPTHNTDLSLYQIQTTEEPFVRFRKCLSLCTYPTQKPFKLIDATDIFTQYGHIAKDVYYMAGLYMNARADSLDAALVTYLTKPDTSKDTYSSWIADNHMETIVTGAASIVFDVLGKADEKQRFNILFLDSIKELQMNYINGGG